MYTQVLLDVSCFGMLCGCVTFPRLTTVQVEYVGWLVISIIHASTERDHTEDEEKGDGLSAFPCTILFY